MNPQRFAVFLCGKTINMQFTWGGPSFNANVNIVWQVEELRQRVRELEERERKESKKLADEDALRKIRVAEETIEHLQKKLAATKQVCLVEQNYCLHLCPNQFRSIASVAD